MSSIGAVWTGNGLADGTLITSGNVNEPGNHIGGGVTWTAGATGVTLTTEGDGYRVVAPSGGDGRVRGDIDASTHSLRVQAILTVDATPTGGHQGFFNVRSASDGNMGWLQLRSDMRLSVYISTSITAAHSPALALGDRVLIDAVFALHDLPSTSNGRVLYRARNLTNPNWNSTGEFFWDSGYALNLGVNNPVRLLSGKTSTGNVPAPGLLLERVGMDAIVVNSTHTNEAAAKSYLASTPGDPLPTPALTIVSTARPSSQGANNGSITASWPPVAGAHHYEAGIASGNVATGFTTIAVSATSPYTWTNLSAGTYTVAVRAVPEEG